MLQGFYGFLVCLAVALSGKVCLADEHPPCTYGADIIFLIDASTSIGPEQFQQQLTWAADVADMFHLAQGVSAATDGTEGSKFGAVVYSYNVTELFPLGEFDKRSTLRQALMSAPYLGQSSHTHSALLKVRDLDLFSEAKGGRPKVKDFVILVTDGRASYGTQALIAAHQLKTSGVTVVTAGLQLGSDIVALRRLATSKDHAFYLRGETVEPDDLIGLGAGVAEKICLIAAET